MLYKEHQRSFEIKSYCPNGIFYLNVINHIENKLELSIIPKAKSHKISQSNLLVPEINTPILFSLATFHALFYPYITLFLHFLQAKIFSWKSEYFKWILLYRVFIRLKLRIGGAGFSQVLRWWREIWRCWRL